VGFWFLHRGLYFPVFLTRKSHPLAAFLLLIVETTRLDIILHGILHANDESNLYLFE
jgi:hypothetical protein